MENKKTNGNGLVGLAPNGSSAWGVLGYSGPGIGVRGNTDTGTGAWGFANSGVGVRGESSTGDGVSGRAAASNGSGVYGYNSGSGYGVAGRSVSGWGMEADGNDVYAVVHQINENGTKSAILQTESYGQRAVYTMESPEVWLEDFGTASLVDGAATVAFEPIFAETVNLEVDYHVFVTPVCQEPVLLFVRPRAPAVSRCGG